MIQMLEEFDKLKYIMILYDQRNKTWQCLLNNNWKEYKRIRWNWIRLERRKEIWRLRSISSSCMRRKFGSRRSCMMNFIVRKMWKFWKLMQMMARLTVQGWIQLQVKGLNMLRLRKLLQLCDSLLIINGLWMIHLFTFIKSDNLLVYSIHTLL